MLSFQYYVTRKIEKRQKDRKVEIQNNRKTCRHQGRKAFGEIYIET